MTSMITAIEAMFVAIPPAVLEVWGQSAYLAGFAFAVLAFAGVTLRREHGRFRLVRDRQVWDVAAVVSVLVTFILILVTGYLGSFIVLVPGAQTFESLKDLVVFLCVVLFGYPALLTVPFAYGLSDLIEGVPPEFLLDWWPGYFINASFFWIAWIFIGRDPDFRRGITWVKYAAFVTLFMAFEPVLWGHLCSRQFTPLIAYHNITSALFFTTSVTWLIAPFAMLPAFPAARALGVFWAAIPERLVARRAASWPIRVVILLPFMLLALVMLGVTAYVTLRSAKADASKLAVRLHDEIIENLRFQLDDYIANTPASGVTEEGLRARLRNLPVASHGIALVIDRSGRVVASSSDGTTAASDRAIEELQRRGPMPGVRDTSVPFAFDLITEQPLSRTTWLARASGYQDRQGGHRDWVVLSVMPEAYYLAGVITGSRRSALVFAAAVVLFLLGGAVLAARVTGGLRRTVRATEALAQGDLAVRLPDSRLEEVSTLSRAFNDMAARLARSIADLRSEVDMRKRRESDLEQSEARTRTSESRLQLALEAGNLAIWDWNIERNRLTWDDAMFRLYGVDRRTFAGTHEAWAACVHPDDRDRAVAAFEAATAEDRDFSTEFRVPLPDGQVRVIRSMGRVIRNPRGVPTRMVGISADITERRRMERLIEAESSALAMIATGGALEDVLESVVTSIEALSPGTIASILLLDPDGIHLRHGAAPNLPAAYSRAVEGEPIGPKAGSCGTAAWRRETVVVADIERDALWEDYRELARAHGLRACWSTPILDSGGHVLGTFALYYRSPREPRSADLDLIGRAARLAGLAIERGVANAERRSLEEQFRQAQKMEAVGHLAAGVAHDFNNLLTIISGYSQLLDAESRESSFDREAIAAIRDAGDRAASLTRQLLAFSRKTVLQPKVLDLNADVRETEKILRRVIGEDVELVAALEPSIMRIQVDPGQLSQALMNLSVNARDAMPRGGTLTLRTHRVTLTDADATRLSTDARAGSYVVLSVSDTGVGMTPDVRERIFEPFFTTKGVGKGTGLGLAMVYGFIKQSGGHIDVRSSAGEGTTFDLYFPLVLEPESAHAADARPGQTVRGTETVLLVEDDPGVRALSTRALGAQGYRLLVGVDGQDALRLAAEHAGPIDIVVTDVVMPGLSGRELADTLQQRYPGIRVLYVSGYTDDAIVRAGVMHDQIAFLSKPYDHVALARKVREVLDAAPNPS